jgi:hypothetical protein
VTFLLLVWTPSNTANPAYFTYRPSFFQQRCIRRIQQLKHQGVTILFVSHDLDAVRSLADHTIWMDHGRVHMQGRTDEVVSKYLAAMVTRGRKEIMEEQTIGKPLIISDELDMTEEALARMPKFLTHVPNVDHRYGNGKARIQGIGVYGKEGDAVSSVVQSDRICIRISVEFQDDVEQPNVGFMLRNRLGQDVTGTNLLFEGTRLPAARAGERMSVDFVMDLPLLHAGFYYFSPAVADGTLAQRNVRLDRQRLRDRSHRARDHVRIYANPDAGSCHCNYPRDFPGPIRFFKLYRQCRTFRSRNAHTLRHRSSCSVLDNLHSLTISTRIPVLSP